MSDDHQWRAIGPHDGRELRVRSTIGEGELHDRLDRAGRAQAEWAARPLAERCAILEATAAQLRERAGSLAALMAEEMGKPLAQGRKEAEKCAWACEHYAEHAADYLADEPIVSDATRSYVAYRPLGVIVAIMPWNFPLWQVFRHGAPALAAGNALAVKHAPSVPGCSQAIVELLAAAGLPADLYAELVIPVDLVPDAIAHPAVAGATCTGSERAGRAVAEAAGRALKPCVLELGGSDPYVVLADADLEVAVDACVTGRLINSGQSCIAAKRWIVVEDLREAFTERVAERLAAQRVGDPRAEDTDVGPLARHDLRDVLHRQVAESVAQGARCLLGGELPAGPGAYYPVTLLDAVRPGTPAFDDELFGPVAAICPAAGDEQALALAGRSRFGLGAAVFTRDLARGERLAREELPAGFCVVNDFVRSDPRLPFGGVRASGFGRELGGLGIREFVNAKTVYVA